jgi:hypothetical protein
MKILQRKMRMNKEIEVVTIPEKDILDIIENEL